MHYVESTVFSRQAMYLACGPQVGCWRFLLPYVCFYILLCMIPFILYNRIISYVAIPLGNSLSLSVVYLVFHFDLYANSYGVLYCNVFTLCNTYTLYLVQYDTFMFTACEALHARNIC